MNTLAKLLKSLGDISQGRNYRYTELRRALSKTGIATTAIVLDMAAENTGRYGYLKIRFWVKIRVKGSVSYRHIQTLVKKEHLPAIGDTIEICYCPENLSRVVIL